VVAVCPPTLIAPVHAVAEVHGFTVSPDTMDVTHPVPVDEISTIPLKKLAPTETPPAEMSSVAPVMVP